jgi:outer membrane protein assembly factor BamB
MTLTPEMRSKYPQALPSHALACFDLHTGKVLWQKWLDGDILTSPVAHEGSVYLTTFSGTVMKLSQKSGEIQAATHLRATSIPSVDKDGIYITKRSDKDGKVCESIAMLDLKSLEKISEFNSVEAPYLDQKVQSRSLLKDKAMKMDAGNGFGGGAPEVSGYRRAEFNIGYSNVSSLQSFQGSSLFTRNGRVYNCMGNRVYCVDPKTKKTDWDHSIDGNMTEEGGYLATAPIAAGDYLITVTLSGTVKILDMKSGKTIKEIATNHQVRTQPIVYKGRIYVPTTEGSLVCIDTGDKKIDGWPMMMMNSQHIVN